MKKKQDMKRNPDIKRKHTTRNTIIALTAASIAVVALIMGGIAPELVRYVRMRRM